MIVKGTNLKIVKGDTEHINVSMTKKDTGQSVPFPVGSVLYFSVKCNAESTEYVIRKTITNIDNGTMVIDIDNADTENLHQGIYCYDIRWTDGKNIKTIIPMSIFEITNFVGDVLNE